MTPIVHGASLNSHTLALDNTVSAVIAFDLFLNIVDSTLHTSELLLFSDVKRGQILEAEDEAEDYLLRPRTSSRPEKSCVKQIKLVIVQRHQKYSPHHYTDETTVDIISK